MKLINLTIAALLLLGLSTQVNASQQGEEPKIKEVQVNINDALVPKTANAFENVKAVVSGLFSNGCYSYSRSKVTHSNNSNVHKVSIFANLSPGMCLMVLVPYTKEVELGELTPGDHRIRFVNGDETYSEQMISVK